MPKECSNTNQFGFSLVEVILSSATFVLLVTALVGAFLYGQESTLVSGNRARAVLLAEEGEEATRNIRDAGFANLIDGTYGLTTTGAQWNLSGSSDTTDIFQRSVTIATVDQYRKQVTSTVTWQQNPQRTGSISLVTYLTNWLRQGIGNWANPTEAANINVSGANDGVKIQVVGNYAYLVRAGGSPNFAIVDISTPASPALVGSLTVSGSPSNIYVSGSYAYVTSNGNATELQIISVANPAAPALVSSYNAPGNNNANGAYVVGTTAYVARANAGSNPDFLIVSVANPASPSLLGSINTGSTSYEVVVSGNYAYVASSSNSQELMVINVATPAAPTIAGGLNLSGNTDAETLALFGTTVIIGQGSTLATVNISSPTTPNLLGSLVLGGKVNDIALTLGNANTYVFIATSDTANEFKVVSIATPSSPTLLGQQNITGNNPLFGVAYNSSLDRAVGVGQSDTEELVVIAPN